jgi:hypothetical protein
MYRLEGMLSKANYKLSSQRETYILWHVYSFIGNDCEISNYTTAIAK